MKTILAVAMAAFAVSAFAQGITTNIVVYTDVHSPSGTAHYCATRLSLAIRDGLVTECRNEGVFDLFLVIPAEKAAKAGAGNVQTPRLSLRERRRLREAQREKERASAADGADGNDPEHSRPPHGSMSAETRNE